MGMTNLPLAMTKSLWIIPSWNSTNKFKCLESGPAGYLLGFAIKIDKPGNYNFLKNDYMGSVLERFDMQDCNPASNHIPTGFRAPTARDEEGVAAKRCPYPHSVLYASTLTDLSYLTLSLVVFCHDLFPSGMQYTTKRLNTSFVTSKGLLVCASPLMPLPLNSRFWAMGLLVTSFLFGVAQSPGNVAVNLMSLSTTDPNTRLPLML